jgi:glycosyltransferase involved in cell wall biosynthesis
VEIRTTTLRQADLFIREDTCQAAPYRLLYTGRMEKTKGLLDLIRALALLVGRGTQVELDLVGGSEREAHFIEELSELAGQLQVGERVHHQGYIPFGPELFEYYKKADIFVIPSYAEGFPRSIWEAMAHSLPVVATSVGSIPFYLKDGENATIIPPGEPEKLAQAINELLHSEIKRRAYIRNGLRLAQENVLETQTKLLVETISAYLSRQK